MADLGELNGSPRNLTVGGKTYAVYPLRLEHMGDLQRWVDSQIPNPLDLVRGHLDGLSVEERKFVLKEAMAESRKPTPKLGSPEADSLVQSIEGIKELLYLSIRAGDPSFTRDRAAQLYGDLDMNKVGELFATTGLIQPTDDDDPKAGTGSASPMTGGASTTGS